MRVGSQAQLLLAVGGGVAATTLASTAAFARARPDSWQETVAGVTSLPATAAVFSPLVAGALLIHPRTRAAGRQAGMVAMAGLGGVVAGAGAARLLGANAQAAALTDAQLPAVDRGRVVTMTRETLDDVDRTQPDIVIWAPGTLRPEIPHAFAEGVRTAFGSDVSLSKLPTRMDYSITQGVADSAVVLRNVVAELDRTRKPGQRILLAGESQGSWAIGVALTDPATRAAVDRVSLWGNPGVSPHQFEAGQNERVIEFGDDHDPVSRPFRGDPEVVISALRDTFDGGLWHAWRLPPLALANPYEASLLVRSGLRLLTPGGYDRDAHNYREYMPIAARFLADAPRPE